MSQGVNTRLKLLNPLDRIKVYFAILNITFVLLNELLHKVLIVTRWCGECQLEFIHLDPIDILLVDITRLVMNNNLSLSIFEEVGISPQLNLIINKNRFTVLFFWVDHDIWCDYRLFGVREKTDALELKVIKNVLLGGRFLIHSADLFLK